MAKYSPNTEAGKCLFCEIGAGKIQTPGVFFENKEYMAFLSIFPNTEGFSVLIPKRHYGSDVLKMPDKALTKMVLTAKRIAKSIEDTFEDVGRVGLIMEGTGIDHAHIKLFPMHGTGHMKEGVWKQYLSGRSDYIEKYTGYIISSDGPAADHNHLKKLAQRIRKNI